MAEETSPKKTCFIAMPISTPEHLVKTYGDDPDHFRHVLQCLFIPAIRAAGMEPISPISKGSEVIHADIIQHLQTADLVLVDMSALNANAFFEFGIRTSLNKPVCVVHDDLTPKIPFDAAPLNSETYRSRLDAWIVDEERPKISAHVKAALERSGGKNQLWRHFGFSLTAGPTEPPKNSDEKLDLVLSSVMGLSNRLEALEQLPKEAETTWSEEGPFAVALKTHWPPDTASDRVLQTTLSLLRKQGWIIEYEGETLSFLPPEGLTTQAARNVVEGIIKAFPKRRFQLRKRA